jgi:hypothetical protein
LQVDLHFWFLLLLLLVLDLFPPPRKEEKPTSVRWESARAR